MINHFVFVAIFIAIFVAIVAASMLATFQPINTKHELQANIVSVTAVNTDIPRLLSFNVWSKSYNHRLILKSRICQTKTLKGIDDTKVTSIFELEATERNMADFRD